MTIVEITPGDYASLTPATAYDSLGFINLNAHKAEEVRYIGALNGDGRLIGGQALGLRNGLWRAPFSAPFSAGAGRLPEGFLREVEQILAAPAQAAWPSECYECGDAPFKPVFAEHNFHYPLSRAAEYEAYLSRSARYNHHRCLRLPFAFEATSDLRRAYSIIDANRRAMGYPLAMTLDQVEATRAIIPADYFVLTLEGVDVASAIIFRPVKSVAQVIYWGDHPEARKSRAMNRLAWEVMHHYATTRPEIHTVDIGPASTDGIINQGLADFKLSIGCIDTPRQIYRSAQ